jgi:hypothetical protein
MDLVDLADKFCEPVVADNAMRDPMLDSDTYSNLLIERNSEDLCGWAKCPHKIVSRDFKTVVFCSKECEAQSQRFAASLVPDRPATDQVGAIIERFADQRPPKPLTITAPDLVEGFRLRIGPHRAALDAIERWFGAVATPPPTEMSARQVRLFDFVSDCLKAVDFELARDGAAISFFASIDLTDTALLVRAPRAVQMAFSIAIYEFLTHNDVGRQVASVDMPSSLYADLLGIVSRAHLRR